MSGERMVEGQMGLDPDIEKKVGGKKRRKKSRRSMYGVKRTQARRQSRRQSRRKSRRQSRRRMSRRYRGGTTLGIDA